VLYMIQDHAMKGSGEVEAWLQEELLLMLEM
jgi:hypothetical protein